MIPDSTAVAGLDVAAIRKDFPILDTRFGKRPLVYLDNAASAQKPQVVIDRLRDYAAHEHANIHRGVHRLSQAATSAYEAARETVAGFLNAAEARECLFTRGTTEAINLVAHSWAVPNLQRGDEIVLTTQEHHANIVPWQLVAEQTGAKIVVAPIDERGCLIVEQFEALLSERTRLVAFVHASNALGVINPARELIDKAHDVGAVVLLDGAQSVPHFPIDVRELGCDFFTFSGHKVGGPTGIGVLYGRAELLEGMRPYQGGGDMIDRVSFAGTTFRSIPERFEAGTPHIEGAIGLGAALQYLRAIDPAAIHAHEEALLHRATRHLRDIPGLHLYGDVAPEAKVPVLSFTIEGTHPSDVGMMLDLEGIAVRTGHHCCMPLWQHYGIEGTTRASFAYYNTPDEADAFAASLAKIVERLR